MNKVTQKDILIFNEKYYSCKNYSQVARETGFSASTIRKYVDKNWQPPEVTNKIFFKKEDLPEFSSEIFEDVEDFGDLCVLSEEEKEEIKILWNELSV